MNERHFETTANVGLYLDKRGQVAVVTIDVPGEDANVLDSALVEELRRILADIELDRNLSAIVLASGKPDCFLTSPVLEDLRELNTPQATDRARAGQRILTLLEQCPRPIVAAIHGECSGGGLELALTCRARVVSDSPATQLALPEVRVGLLPAMGATQRLPRLIGVRAALDLLLTGRQIDGRTSNALGLADDVVPESVLVEAASEIALRLATNPTLRKHRHQGPRGAFSELLLSENPLGRELFFARAKRRLRQKTRGLYPAPERILDVVRVGLARGTEQGLLAEAYAFGELAVTPEARALLNLKLATEELKKDRGVDDPRILPRPVTQVAVIGAGLMGVGISYVTATQARTPVLLKETDDAALGRGLARLQRLFDDTGGRGQTPAQVAPATDYSDLAAAGLVIEAVFEELELKRRVLRETEERTHPEAIFASNTSSIPISQIAAESKHPESVIGMHYFSPVHKMPLLEVIVTQETAPWVTATAVAFGKKQGKTVIVVRDGAGFYSTRIVTPYLQEAVRLLAEGVSVQSIDQALVDWGFPVGPLTLLDEVGVDVIDQVSGVLSQAFGARMTKPLALHALVSDRRLGRKSQRGFYLYPSAPKTSQRTSLVARFRSRFARRSGRPVDPDLYRLLAVEPTKRVPPGVIADRCALSMINEAAHCLGQGVVRRPRDADVGAVLGLGFPAFRGGPLRYVDSQGAVNIVKKLKRYAGEYGERFAPAPGLVEVAEKGVKFYP